MTGMPPATARHIEMTAASRCQSLELHAVEGDEFLVGGNDAFAGVERLAHPFAGGVEAAG